MSTSLREIHPEQWVHVHQYFENLVPGVDEAMCDSFVFRAMPRLRGIQDPSAFYRVVKDELLYHLGNDRIPGTASIHEFSERLRQLNQRSDADPISERWNRSFRAVGWMLLVANIAYVLLLLLVPAGFSMGPGLMLIGVVIWTSPSIISYIAIRRPVSSFFGPWQLVLMILAAVFAVLYVYWLVVDVQTHFFH